MQPPSGINSGIEQSIALGDQPLEEALKVDDFIDDYPSILDTVQSRTVDDDPAYKPFAFAMRPAPAGAIHIRYGVLVSQINRLEIDENGVQYQAGISSPVVSIPDNFTDGADPTEPRYGYATLPWRGDVYLYWETDCSGTVTLCDLRGPAQPSEQPLPNPNGGKFFLQIGTCDDYEIPAIAQTISSDVYWISAFEGECDSSSSDSGSGSSSSSSSAPSSSSASDSGSDKSTAIVPMAWHDKGYGALFTMESNEVLFEFIMRDVDIKGRTTVVRIDDRYLQVCSQNTMTVAGAPCGDRSGSVGAIVKGNALILTASLFPHMRPRKVTLKLTGVRKGFTHLDMPERSKAQFTANEKFINSAYPKE